MSTDTVQQHRTRAAYARRTAESRALKRTGQRRVAAEDWYPELERLAGEHQWTNAEMAQWLHLSVRRVQQIRGIAGPIAWEQRQSVNPPKERAAIAEEFQPMLERTPDGFKAFFEHFSGFYLTDLGYMMIEAALGNSNCLINVPPRHAKTVIIAVWLPIWLLTLDRNEQIIIVSDTNTHSKAVTYEISQQLEFNPALVAAFGRYAPEKSKESPWRPSQGELVVLGRSGGTRALQYSVLSRGSGQQILGREATWAILDDITTQEITESERERDKLHSWVRQSVFSRLQQGSDEAAAGHALVVGQRVHLNDLYGELEAEVGLRGPGAGQPLWHVTKFPAILKWPEDNDGIAEVLWPEERGFEYLMEQYNRMGHDAFEKMYQQNPMPEGSRFVQPEWLVRCRDETRNGYESTRAEVDFLPMVRIVSVDPSPTKDNALIVADMVAVRDMFACQILETATWRGNMREFVARTDKAIRHYNPDYLIIERSTVTNWLIQDPLYEDLRQRVRVLEHTTGSNKGDPELGILSLAADFEAGRIRTPYGDETGREMTKLLEDQALVYGHHRPDDLLMALWFIKWNYRRLRPPWDGGGRISVSNSANGGTYGYIKRAQRQQDTRREGYIMRRQRGN